MVGIIIAMESELTPYLRFPYKTETFYGKKFFIIDVKGKETVIVLSGIGKVNATFATTLLIERYHPRLVISTGVSGGLGQSKIMSIVVAKSTCQHDCDTSALGDPIGLVSTVNKIYFDASEEYSRLFERELNAKSGVLACGDQFVADKTRAQFIVDTFGAVACDMESGAIGQTCFLTDVPYVAIRCISDGADEGADISFLSVVNKASEILGAAVIDVLGKL